MSTIEDGYFRSDDGHKDTATVDESNKCSKGCCVAASAGQIVGVGA